jgi:hypothetical protein
MSDALDRVLAVYNGSDGDVTKALFAELEKRGPVGVVAVNLFRAQKNSARAKVYRGGGYRGMAYDRKQWALDNLAIALREHGATIGVTWGWGTDAKQAFYASVLYVDLPQGQVSFHSATRGPGPNYGKEWDGARDASPGRICSFVAQVLSCDPVAFPVLRIMSVAPDTEQIALAL